MITLASIPQWELLIIIIFSILGLYLLTVLIIYLLMKNAQKKTFSALDSLIQFEKDRMDFANKVYDTLKENYNLSNNIKMTVEEQNELLSSHSVDMVKAKSQTDYLLIYFQKFMKEHGIRKKSPYAELYSQIDEHLFLDAEKDNYPYKRYNSLAAKYNSFRNMGFFSPFSRGSKNPEAPTL